MKTAGSNRQTEHRVLVGPLGRSIAQASDADAARQSSFDGGLHEVGREERERDRHIDLSNAAFVTRSNLLDTGHGASNNLIKPPPAARDRCDEYGAGLGANRSTVVRRNGSRHDNIASPPISAKRRAPGIEPDPSRLIHIRLSAAPDGGRSAGPCRPFPSGEAAGSASSGKSPE